MALNEARVRQTLFCETCDNVLYPKEEDGTSNLLWECRLCGTHERKSDEFIYVIHQSDIKRGVGEEADSRALESIKDFVNDRTVMRAQNKPCPKCKKTEAAWFINPLTKTDHDMTIYFACVACQHVWSDPKIAHAAIAEQAVEENA